MDRLLGRGKLTITEGQPPHSQAPAVGKRGKAPKKTTTEGKKKKDAGSGGSVKSGI